jgi:hypothetical protein
VCIALERKGKIMSTLADHIRSKKKERELIASDAGAVRDEWRRELDRLMDDIDEWLRDSIKAGLDVKPGEVEISEDRLGTYSAPTRVVTFGGRRVEIRPCARFIVGGDGRVDIDGDFGMDILIYSRPDGAWHIVNDRVKTDWRPLNRENLEQALKAHL